MEGHFLSTCISRSTAHPSLKLHTVNLGPLNSIMWKFDQDQTNSHRIVNKSFGVEECWFYKKIDIAIESTVIKIVDMELCSPLISSVYNFKLEYMYLPFFMVIFILAST